MLRRLRALIAESKAAVGEADLVQFVRNEAVKRSALRLSPPWQ